MRLIFIGLALACIIGCNQISGADDFTFEEEHDANVDAGDDTTSDTDRDSVVSRLGE